MDRRHFFRTLGLLGGASMMTAGLKAAEPEGTEEFNAVLVDTTACAGCMTCEETCAKTHGLPVPNIDDYSVFEHIRETSTTRRTVVNCFRHKSREVFVKRQCLHCAQPACAAACPTKGMEKTKAGPVVWHPERCMGCRYCMIACPFEVPKFQFDSPTPQIIKCDQCWDRVQEGKPPACVETCPEEALVFGKRRDLIEEARARIYKYPKYYVHHIYGEREVGGTGVLYLSSLPFEQLGFKAGLDSTPIPEHTKPFLYSVPLILLLWPAMLLGLSRNRRNNEEKEGEEE
jgi:formate dehydrogenase iron-sulfur subunit